MTEGSQESYLTFPKQFVVDNLVLNEPHCAKELRVGLVNEVCQGRILHADSSEDDIGGFCCRDSEGEGELVVSETKQPKVKNRKVKGLNKDKRPHICPQCSRTFRYASLLKAHMRMHTGEKPYKCDVCGKNFRQPGNLATHKKIHLNLIFECSLCDKRFNQRFRLQDHMKLHTSPQRFTCNMCGKMLSSAANLANHKSIHSDKRQFECKVCGRSFNQRSGLKNHMAVHSKVKRFKCEVCDHGFNQLSNLRSHMMVHDNIKPHSCQVCSKSFRQLRALRRHEKTHGPQQQLYCVLGKKLHFHTVCRHHASSGDNGFQCLTCQKSYPSVIKLKRHPLSHFIVLNKPQKA